MSEIDNSKNMTPERSYPDNSNPNEFRTDLGIYIPKSEHTNNLSKKYGVAMGGKSENKEIENEGEAEINSEVSRNLFGKKKSDTSDQADSNENKRAKEVLITNILNYDPDIKKADDIAGAKAKREGMSDEELKAELEGLKNDKVSSPSSPEVEDGEVNEAVEKFMSDIELTEDEQIHVTAQLTILLQNLEKMKKVDIDGIPWVTLEMQINNLLVQEEPIARVTTEIEQRLRDIVNSDSNTSFDQLRKRLSDIYNELYKNKYNTEDKNMPINYLKYLAVSQELQLLDLKHKAIVEGKPIEDLDENLRFEKTYIKKFGFRHGDRTLDLIQESALQEKQEVEARAIEDKQRRERQVYLDSFRTAIENDFIKAEEIDDANALIRDIARKAGSPKYSDKRLYWFEADQRISDKIFELESKENLSTSELEELNVLNDYLGRVWGIIENLQGDTEFRDESDRQKSPEELLLELQQKQQLEKAKIEKEEKEEKQKLARDGYLRFLEQEASYTSNLRKINPEDPGNAPDYYSGNRRYEIPAMTEYEQAEHLARMELLEAAKSKAGRNLERFAELYQSGNAYEQVKNQELETLEDVPGYIEARQKYVLYVEGNVPVHTFIRKKDGSLEPADKDNEPNGLSWHDIKGEADLKRYRLGLQQELVSDIIKSDRFQKKVYGLDENSEEYQYHLRVFTQSAEQVAYNFLYSQHFFEMNQSKWEKDGENWVRRSKSKHSSSAISTFMLAGLEPVDVLVNDMLKDHVEVSKRTRQVITKHGHNWIKKNADKKGVELEEIRDNLHEIVVLANKNKNKNKFYTFDKTNKGYRLYVFSQIPEPELRQMYMLQDGKTKEDLETKFVVNGVEKSVLEMIREGHRISWNSHETPNLFAKTCVQAEKVNQYIKMVTSNTRLIGGTAGGGSNVHDWIEEVKKSVSDIKIDEKDELIRGILHSSIVLDPSKTAPSSYSPEALRNKVTTLTAIGFDANVGPLNYPWEPNAEKKDSALDRLFNIFGS